MLLDKVDISVACMIFSGVHFFLKNVDDLFSRRPNTQFPQKMTSDSAWDALTTYHYKLCQKFLALGCTCTGYAYES